MSAIPTRAQWYGSGASDRPAQESAAALTPGWPSAGDANGAGQHIEDEPSIPVIPDIDFEGSSVARTERETVDVSHRAAEAPLPPLTFGRLSAPEANGAGEQDDNDTSILDVIGVSFDRSPAEDTVAEPTTAVPEAVEIPVRPESEAANGSPQPAQAPLTPVTLASPSSPQANGARALNYGSPSTAAVTEDRSVEEDSAADEIATHPGRVSVSDRLLAEPAQESVFVHPAPRSWRNRRIAVACLAVVIALLVVVTGRDGRRHR